MLTPSLPSTHHQWADSDVTFHNRASWYSVPWVISSSDVWVEPYDFKKIIYLLFLDALSLCCCLGYSLVAVRGLLAVVTFLIAALGL